MRSGSTLQYQIAARLVEDFNRGRRLGWVSEEEFSTLYESYTEDTPDMLVIKTHMQTDLMREALIKGNARAIHCYRDLRDTFVSQMHKGKQTFAELLSRNFLNVQLENYHAWTTSEPVLVSRYEVFSLDVASEIQRIADFLEIDLPEDYARDVAVEFSLENQRRRIENAGESRSATSLENAVFDTQSLLHLDHINTGEIGGWRRVLNEEQTEQIEQIVGPWLQDHGYELSVNHDAIPASSEEFYGQHGEDYLLWEFFEHRTTGFFIDVGAFDGIHLSNSYFFEKKGWKGICVEAHPDYFPECQKNRTGSICINAACVGDPLLDTVEFHVEDSGLYSGVTSSQEKTEQTERYYAGGWDKTFDGYKSTKVKATTLSRILEQIPDTEFDKIDYISIDTEGNELDILRGFNFTDYKPGVLVIETQTFERRMEITAYLARYGYIEARVLSVNTFYVQTVEDASRLLDITGSYTIAGQSHPLGEEYTLKPYRLQNNVNLMRDQLRIEHDQLRTNYDQLKVKHHDLQQQRDQLRMDYDQLTVEHHDLQQERDQLRTDYDQLTVEHHDLQQQRDQLRTAYDQLKIKHHDLQQERDQLRTDYDQLTVEHHDLQQERDQLRMDYDQLTVEHHDLQQERDQFLSQRNRLHAEHEVLAGTLHELNTVRGSFKQAAVVTAKRLRIYSFLRNLAKGQ